MKGRKKLKKKQFCSGNRLKYLCRLHFHISRGSLEKPIKKLENRIFTWFLDKALFLNNLYVFVIVFKCENVLLFVSLLFFL